MNSRGILNVVRAIKPLIPLIAEVFTLARWRRGRRSSNRSSDETLWEEIPYNFQTDWFVEPKPREGSVRVPRVTAEGQTGDHVERKGGEDGR